MILFYICMGNVHENHQHVSISTTSIVDSNHNGINQCHHKRRFMMFFRRFDAGDETKIMSSSPLISGLSSFSGESLGCLDPMFSRYGTVVQSFTWILSTDLYTMSSHSSNSPCISSLPTVSILFIRSLIDVALSQIMRCPCNHPRNCSFCSNTFSCTTYYLPYFCFHNLHVPLSRQNKLWPSRRALNFFFENVHNVLRHNPIPLQNNTTWPTFTCEKS